MVSRRQRRRRSLLALIVLGLGSLAVGTVLSGTVAPDRLRSAVVPTLQSAHVLESESLLTYGEVTPPAKPGTQVAAKRSEESAPSRGSRALEAIDPREADRGALPPH